ncbi:MAG: DUF4973 domain-containing protein [Muribaculaceae bacterium]|nr:DUF4973 domain-containing protein [Muribaculaceae bacterium]
MLKRNKIFGVCMLAVGALTLTTSCNNDWEEEQYKHYIGFKAPLDTDGNSVGVTTVYVPYTRLDKDLKPMYGQQGESHYNLPVVVSGSTTNPDNLTVNIAQSDTLATLNYERFSNRQELWYVNMWDFADVPSTINIAAGQDVALLNIRFHFQGIDLSDRYLLPLTVAPGAGYERNPRKHYATAMLRVLPYTDYAGVFQATNLKFYIVSGGVTDNEPGGMKTVQTYVVDENTVFFYAGQFDESSQLRKDFKVFAKFVPEEGTEGKRGFVDMWSDNPEMDFAQNTRSTYTTVEAPDEVQTYIVRRTLIINDIDYVFTDYRSAVGSKIVYNVKGSMAMERKLNTQMPEEDQIVFE